LEKHIVFIFIAEVGDNMKLAVFRDVMPVVPCSVVDIDITLMMEAVSSPETLVSIYKTTWRNIPEGRHLHVCNYENLKSHMETVCFSKALLCTYKSTWHHSPEKQH
jgi:hypothetical protein